MSRLAPLISRAPQRRIGAGGAAVAVPSSPRQWPIAPTAAHLEDLRLFATGWIGGLIFFATLIG
jgi:hypothetical protein